MFKSNAHTNGYPQLYYHPSSYFWRQLTLSSQPHHEKYSVMCLKQFELKFYESLLITVWKVGEERRENQVPWNPNSVAVGEGVEIEKSVLYLKRKRRRRKKSCSLCPKSFHSWFDLRTSSLHLLASSSRKWFGRQRHGSGTGFGPQTIRELMIQSCIILLNFLIVSVLFWLLINPFIASDVI